MITKACSKVFRPITFADYYVLLMMKDFCENTDRLDKNLTPFFGMPFRFVAIEKDLH